MSNDSWQKTLLVALVLCLFFSVLVSGAAVLLRPIQETNVRLDVQRNLLLAAGLAEAGAPVAKVNELMASVEAQIINLDSGEEMPGVDPATFNAVTAARKSDTSRALDSQEDIARIKRRADMAKVYLLKKDGQFDGVVLPVYGSGLYSTLYGFIALDSDLRTIRGLKFYEQGETAGLGAEVDNPRWLAKWPGKLALDENGQPLVEVIKGGVNPSSPLIDYHVDAISGATMTSRGVSALLKYWLGPEGFGPYLARLKAQQMEAS
ncbi:MAG: Na(+)-translocating NADH-quinone reductase subunit C [Gammaproteobacteria bacterium]|nr:Na(+)-translocating NADH-quinone reductase subunit C [Gammaproteobacteria bacterium]